MQSEDFVSNTKDDEIGLFNVIYFLKGNWKPILGFGFVGMLASVGFLALAQPQYEAHALIEMAQVEETKINIENSINSTVSIESPALLIERLKNPETYSPKVAAACVKEPADREKMVDLVKALTPKNISAVVQISVRSASPAMAKQCVEAVFDMIKEQQAILIERHQNDLKKTLNDLRSRLIENKALISQAEIVGLYKTAYLAHHDELLYLTHQIDELQRILSREAATRLLSPIYASSNKVFPHRTQTLIFGTAAGLMLGLLFAMCRQAIANLSTNDNR